MDTPKDAVSVDALIQDVKDLAINQTQARPNSKRRRHKPKPPQTQQQQQQQQHSQDQIEAIKRQAPGKSKPTTSLYEHQQGTMREGLPNRTAVNQAGAKPFQDTSISQTIQRVVTRSQTQAVLSIAAAPVHYTSRVRDELRQWEKAPTPTADYVLQSNVQSVGLQAPRPLLLVLDLNGTLLQVSTSRQGIPRFGLNEFLRYVTAHHSVMIWSSARPQKVQQRCAHIFGNAGLPLPAIIWDRTHFKLPAAAYNDRVQVYKRLSMIWNCNEIPPWFDQTNTMLVDDTTAKAASEPYNLVRVEEATRQRAKIPDLGMVASYIEEASWQSNVSNYIKTSPFLFDEAKASAFKWSSLRP